LEEELRARAQENIIKKQNEPKSEDAYTPESRVKLYEEMQADKKRKEEEEKKNSMFAHLDELKEKKEPPPVYNKQGEVRQCNEGKYEFDFSESEDRLYHILEIKLPKFLDTSLINVDLQPQYVRMDIKGKITQLVFPSEIKVEESQL